MARGSTHRRRRGGLEEVSPLTGRGLGVVTCPSQIFFKFWVQNGPFLFKDFLCSGKGGIALVPPPKYVIEYVA